MSSVDQVQAAALARWLLRALLVSLMFGLWCASSWWWWRRWALELQRREVVLMDVVSLLVAGKRDEARRLLEGERARARQKRDPLPGPRKSAD